MPFFRDLSHRRTLLRVVGTIVVCSLLSRASVQALPDAVPHATGTPHANAIAHMASPYTTKEATAFATAETSSILVSGSSDVVFTDATQPPPTHAPTHFATAAPTETAAPTPAAVIATTASAQTAQAEPTAVAPILATPDPSDPPLHFYATDSIRIEIRRYELKNLVYFTAEIWLTDATQLRSAFSSDRFDGAREPVRDIADRNGAILAINGDFATFNNGGIIVRNGELFRSNRSTRQLLVIDKSGDLQLFPDPPENAKEAAAEFIADRVWQTVVFGPVLVENGVAVPLPSEFFISTRGASEPRTAIGQIGPLHYLWIVVDGRQNGYSRGVSLARLQELFIEHGAQVAFNLDGGGSTTLYYDGDVINSPANGGERHVPDIFYIGR